MKQHIFSFPCSGPSRPSSACRQSVSGSSVVLIEKEFSSAKGQVE